MEKKSYIPEIPDYKLWIYNLCDDTPRILHIMIRVSNINNSLNFYLNGLSMKLVGTLDVPQRRVTAYFVGFSVGLAAIELADYWDDSGPYDHSVGYSHVCIGVPNLEDTLLDLQSIGAEVTIKPTVLVTGMPRTAFVKDPDKYTVQLFQMNNV